MRTSKTGFTRKEVAWLTGLRPATISYYMHNKLIKADVSSPSGRGVPKKFSEQNLVEFLLLKQLSKNGFELHQIQLIIMSFKFKIIEWAKAVGERKAENKEMDEKWMRKKYSSIEFLNRLDPKYLEKYRLFLLIFDAHEPPESSQPGVQIFPMQLNISEYPVEIEGKTVKDKMQTIIREMVFDPPETFSTVIIIDIRDLFIKIKDKLSKF